MMKGIEDRPLDDRESSILRTIVHEYISTGKPVGSRSFVQKYSLSLSPATIRNIMYDLEGLYYLKQPHTSAGRVPTDRGYRYYVDSLLDSYDFSMNKRVEISDDIIRRELELQKVFDIITRTLSLESHYAGVMISPRSDFTVVKRIELIPLEANEVLCILITRTGMIINKKVTISVTVTHDRLREYSRYLTNELCGYSLKEVKSTRFDDLRSDKSGSTDLELALDIAQLAFQESSEPELHIEGVENLLKLPEMTEEGKLQSLLNIIEEKNVLRRILLNMMSEDGLKVVIGGEIPEHKVVGCSMVATAYKIGNSKVGVLGVLGPTRMDYEKVVPLVDYTGRVLSDLLTRMSK